MADQSAKSQPAKALKVATIGKSTKSTVPAGLFGEPFNESLVHEAARADLNARRQGTHSSLTRGEVAMTGAKAWRQKGTGRARVGALSVPHRRGGGNAFATKPRNYTFKVNRKARRKALRSALSVHAERDSLAVLPAGAFGQPATKQAADGLAKWAPTYPVLVLLTPDEADAGRSYRNLPRVTVLSADDVGVADVIGHRSMVASEGAVEVLAGRVGEVVRGNGDSLAPAAEEPEAEEPQVEEAEQAKVEETEAPEAEAPETEAAEAEEPKAEEPETEEPPAEEAKAEEPEVEEPKAETPELDEAEEPEAEEPAADEAEESEADGEPAADEDGNDEKESS